MLRFQIELSSLHCFKLRGMILNWVVKTVLGFPSQVSNLSQGYNFKQGLEVSNEGVKSGLRFDLRV